MILISQARTSVRACFVVMRNRIDAPFLFRPAKKKEEEEEEDASDGSRRFNGPCDGRIVFVRTIPSCVNA
jgi:hypothetical protein